MGRADYYLCGTFNNWDPQDSRYRFSGNRLQITLSSGDYMCKVTNGSWDWSADAEQLSYMCTPREVKGMPNDHWNICFSLSSRQTLIFQMMEGDSLCVTGQFAANRYAEAAYYDHQQDEGPDPEPYSGTLPVVFINTENGAPILDKENYVNATGYIDNRGLSGYASLGSIENPVVLGIRGRGNYTWTGFEKKPYKIKFSSKQNVLGMGKNKHWALMASADDNLGFLRNPVGYLLSKRIGLRWTPSYVPVELMLNGEYMGLYMLTETIRVDNNRVNITGQEDMTSHADSITGGWLVEIDNYMDVNTYCFTEGNGERAMITMKSPEVLSSAQRSYIISQIDGLNSVFYESTSVHWEQQVDLTEAVKYYLVQEIMEDTESYHGSCYLYKDIDFNGAQSKWYFGPVWDFGNSFHRNANRFIYDGPSFSQIWIGQIASFPSFQSELKRQWYVFYHNIYPTLRVEIQALANAYSEAAIYDAVRWQGTNVQTANNMTRKEQDFWNRLQNRVNWLYSQWGEGTAPTATQTIETEATPLATKCIIDGQMVIIRGESHFNVTGQRIR